MTRPPTGWGQCGASPATASDPRRRWWRGNRPAISAYRILSGFPARHYRADVTITPEGSGCLIAWSATFDAKIPGTGRLLVIVLKRMLGGFATGAAGYADRLRTHQP